MKKYNLSEIMRKAWYLYDTYQLSFSHALKSAWAWFKLRTSMYTGVAHFYFTKADGSVREAFGTLKSDLIGDVKGTGRKPGEYLQVYWDVEKGAFRSFKLVNLVTIG